MVILISNFFENMLSGHFAKKKMLTGPGQSSHTAKVTLNFKKKNFLKKDRFLKIFSGWPWSKKHLVGHFTHFGNLCNTITPFLHRRCLINLQGIHKNLVYRYFISFVEYKFYASGNNFKDKWYYLYLNISRCNKYIFDYLNVYFNLLMNLAQLKH